MNKAVFLDRDGTIMADMDYMFGDSEIILFPKVRESLLELKEAGFKLFILTNQSGVFRGYFTLEQAEAFQKKIMEALGLPADFFDGVCMAIDDPKSCGGYRKPSPKYLLECAEIFDLDLSESWMAGDRRSDWECAINAGAKPGAFSTGKKWDEETREYIKTRNIPVFDTFEDFKNKVLEGENGS